MKLASILLIASTALACGGGAAAPSATASANGGFGPLTATFDSTVHGYSVAYEPGWSVTGASGPWPVGEVLRHGDPRLDAIVGTTPAGKVRFVAASQPVDPGTTSEEFAGEAGPFTCPPGQRLPIPVTVDGITAVVTLDGCPSLADLGGLIYDVVLVSDGRGYDFTIDGQVTSAEAAAWLATIRLDPGAAIDP